MNWSEKDQPLWDETVCHGDGEQHCCCGYDVCPDSPIVCSTHGRFVPCRMAQNAYADACRYTQDEGWVDRVSRYQRGELPDWRDT